MSGNFSAVRGLPETREEAFAALDALPRAVRRAVADAPYAYHCGSVLAAWARLMGEVGPREAGERVCRRLARISRLNVIAAYGSTHPEAR